MGRVESFTMLERDKKTINSLRDHTGDIRATIVERAGTLRPGTRSEGGKTLKITRIQTAEAEQSPGNDAARTLLDLLREDATPETATPQEPKAPQRGPVAQPPCAKDEDMTAPAPRRLIGEVETIEDILRRDATPEAATPGAAASETTDSRPERAGTTAAPRSEPVPAPATSVAEKVAPEHAPDAPGAVMDGAAAAPVDVTEDHAGPRDAAPVARASFDDSAQPAGYDVILSGEPDAPEVQPLPRLPAETAPRPGWRDLAAIPFRSGDNDALRAQMYVSGSDERVIRVIDDLRTQLLRSMQTEVWNRIAITSPTSGCGASFTALNLALSISRIPDFRTILMDLNQRNPSIAPALRLKGHSDMQSFLRGDVPAHEHLLKYSDTLALGLNTERSRNPSEILHARSTGQVLERMIDDMHPDIVLYDMPAMLDHDDVSAFLPQVDGVLLVADATQTLGSQIEECERRLAGKTPLLGVILNRAKRASDVQQAA